jgi:hypothetical protein
LPRPFEVEALVSLISNDVLELHNRILIQFVGSCELLTTKLSTFIISFTV